MAEKKDGGFDVATRVVSRLAARLPNFPDPDAVPEDTCLEMEITWQDWADLKAADALLSQRDKP